ncbi:MAG TPA: hypothetical protein VGE30_00990 [Candidatus Saccharimonadales bacterium]
MKARIALIGPHGAGKSSLAKALVANYSSDELRYELERIVTSRKPRPGEDDSEYVFVTQEAFDAARDKYLLVQANRGVRWNYALAADKPVAPDTVRVYVVTPETAVELRALFEDDVLVVAVLPPSLAVLRQRLSGRDTTIEENELSLRLGLGERDVEQSQQIADAVFYNNKDLERSAADLNQLIHSLISKE